MNGIMTRLHWTDQPHKWHVNDREEIFVVLDGRVEMKYRIDGQETFDMLERVYVFYAYVSTERVAHSIEQARILVMETADSN